LLIAAGGVPNIADLDLEAAGVAHAPGGIFVGKTLKTTNKRIYAVGAVTGDPGATQIAEHQADLVIRNALFRLPVRFNGGNVPKVTYTDPELAHVGMTEADARKRGYAMRILRWPLSENQRARAEHACDGHIKIVTTRRGRILGATIVGAGAGDLI